MHIKVASYNIRKSIGTDRRRRPRRVFDVLAEINADIVALQEVDRRFGRRMSSLSPEAIVRETGYCPVRYGVRTHSLGWHGNALLARKGIKVLASRRLILPALEPRGAVLADLAVKNTTLRIVGMHFGLIGHWRKLQARAIVDQLQALEGDWPTILMGDLNEWNTRRGALSTFEAIHHVAVPGPSYHSALPVLAYDRIITTRDIDILETGVHTSDLARVTSDHLPVWATLHLPPHTSQGRALREVAF